jgi:hypothetical protein
MSTEIAKALLSQFYKDGQVVYENVSDPIYKRLGYTQIFTMLLTIPALWTLLIPIPSNQPTYQAYEAFDKFIANEYGNPSIEVNIINHLLCAISSFLIGSFIGRKIGSGVWALYCLMRTKCQSHHTMDIALSNNNNNQVVKNLMFTVFESGRESYGELINTAQKKELALWIQKVNIFFTKKRQRDLKRGKVQSAEEWWIIKKKFYQDFKPEALIDKLNEYTDKIQLNINKTKANYDHLVNHIMPTTQQNKQSYQGDKVHYIKWLLGVIRDFDSSIGMRHQRRSSQSIYKNKKSLNCLFDAVEKNQQHQAELLESMAKAETIMQNVISRLQLNLAEIPKTPDWLNHLISYDLEKKYQTQCEKELSDLIKKVTRCQKHLAPGEQENFIENFKQTADQTINGLQADEWIIDIRQSDTSSQGDDYSTARSLLHTQLNI